MWTTQSWVTLLDKPVQRENVGEQNQQKLLSQGKLLHIRKCTRPEQIQKLASWQRQRILNHKTWSGNWVSEVRKNLTSHILLISHLKSECHTFDCVTVHLCQTWPLSADITSAPEWPNKIYMNITTLWLRPRQLWTNNSTNVNWIILNRRSDQTHVAVDWLFWLFWGSNVVKCM